MPQFKSARGIQMRQNSTSYGRAFITFLILSLSFPTFALKIPFSSKELKEGNNCDTRFKSILAEHTETKAFATVLILEMGVGLVPLTASLIEEQVHATQWGKKYGCAYKLHSLLKASSDDKDHADFKKFYTKLKKDYRLHSTQEIPSEDTIKSLIKRANNTGLLCEDSLTHNIKKKDSLFPLRWVILSNQLENRVNQIEAILDELESKENLLENKLEKINDELFEELKTDDREPFTASSALRREYDAWYEQLYTTQTAKIQKIDNFSF